ncbi:MAG: Flp pilus assembly protein CpaB, partial [Sandarakinorhabdus sp.]
LEKRTLLKNGANSGVHVNGTITRLVRKPSANAPPANSGGAGPAAAPQPKGVTVIRGATTKFETVIGP